MKSWEQWDELLGCIQDAALDPGAWPAAIERTTELLGARSAEMTLLNLPAVQAATSVIHRIDPEKQERWIRLLAYSSASAYWLVSPSRRTPQTDTCQNGTCTGANPVVCTALDQCHDVGTCNPSTGACSNPNKADGSVCDDGHACTTNDACIAGQCTGEAPLTCDACQTCDRNSAVPATYVHRRQRIPQPRSQPTR